MFTGSFEGTAAWLRTQRSLGRGARLVAACSLSLGLFSCSSVGGIDNSLSSPISNNDTFATIGYLWGGVRSAIQAKREPSTNTFSLPLTYQVPCSRGGQGSYQGTLAGSKNAGSGTATLAVTATITDCQYDDNVRITTVTSPLVTLSGTIALQNDTWSTVNVRLVASSVTVNGVTCPGGVDVTITGSAPSAQVVSTGTACGRTGAVPLP